MFQVNERKIFILLCDFKVYRVSRKFMPDIRFKLKVRLGLKLHIRVIKVYS